MQSKIDDLQLAIKLSSKSSEIANNEKSKMIAKVSEVEKALGRMEQDLARLQTVSVMDNDNIIKLQNQADNLKKEAERSGSTPAFMEAIENIERIASVLTNREVLTKSKQEEPKV
jgi:CRISPR/Cas system-associated protein Cas10 (large subunit of type III CRISPR-Cas system)